jgi:hypothetical protein
MNYSPVKGREKPVDDRDIPLKIDKQFDYP